METQPLSDADVTQYICTDSHHVPLPRPSCSAEETLWMEASLSSQGEQLRSESSAPAAKDRITQQTATLLPSPRPDPPRHPHTHLIVHRDASEDARQQQLSLSNPSPEANPLKPPDSSQR